MGGSVFMNFTFILNTSDVTSILHSSFHPLTTKFQGPLSKCGGGGAQAPPPCHPQVLCLYNLGAGEAKVPPLFEVEGQSPALSRKHPYMDDIHYCDCRCAFSHVRSSVTDIGGREGLSPPFAPHVQLLHVGEWEQAY